MTVHVLIPVFNRLEMTRRALDCLQTQQLDEPIRLIVINDGSTDGTTEFLSAQKDITVLNGDGSLWWGGAIEAGLQFVLENVHLSDWVLLVNNDTQFDTKFVQRLLDTARAYAPAAVGSVICDEAAPNQLLSIGAVLDTWRLRVRDKLEQPRIRDLSKGPHPVDALSGRGTLYPVAAFSIAGTMKTAWLPHYLADYELALRVRNAGYKLLVSEATAVLSENEYGNSYQPARLIDIFFSVRSAYYLPAIFAFWWRASSLVERLTLLPRLIYVSLKHRRSLL
ncbi:COG1216 Predicted glycosyltransferases [Burkholderiaceae bacterium]